MAAAGAAIGGWTVFLETPEQANKIYKDILEDIGSRYVIGYYPTNKVRDGKRRRVNLAVRENADYQISGRKSYFAPGPDQY
jgi:hypothetical protein